MTISTLWMGGGAIPRRSTLYATATRTKPSHAHFWASPRRVGERAEALRLPRLDLDPGINRPVAFGGLFPPKVNLHEMEKGGTSLFINQRAVNPRFPFILG